MSTYNQGSMSGNSLTSGNSSTNDSLTSGNSYLEKELQSIWGTDLNANTESTGGFHDLASFRAELGNDVAGISDADAYKIIDENLKERAKLPNAPSSSSSSSSASSSGMSTDRKGLLFADENVYRDMANNMRARADKEEAERKRIAAELAAERSRRNLDTSSLLSAQEKLRTDLELEKIKSNLNNNLRGRLLWKSPSSLDDYLVKENIKRELKEELLEEKRRAKKEKELEKMWKSETPGNPRKKSSSRKKSTTRNKSSNRKKSTTRNKSASRKTTKSTKKK